MTPVKETAKNLIGKGKAGPGRPKGSSNKITSDVRKAIIEAANAAGGEGGMVGYLARQADENPNAFMSLMGRLVPLDHLNNGGSFQPTEIILRAASVVSDD